MNANDRNAWLTVAVSPLIAICWLLGPRAATAAPPPAPAANGVAVSVHLASGRVFAAVLDPRTDAGQMWLRFERGGAQLLRPVDWDCVVGADLSGVRLSGRQLQLLVVQVRKEIPAQPVLPPTTTQIVMLGTPEP
jgi:hypothetical protein